MPRLALGRPDPAYGSDHCARFTPGDSGPSAACSPLLSTATCHDSRSQNERKHHDANHDPPDGLRWSADSGKLYFEWRRPGEEEASTYVVSRDGGMPSRLDDAQRKTAPPANGHWDQAHKR